MWTRLLGILGRWLEDVGTANAALLTGPSGEPYPHALVWDDVAGLPAALRGRHA